MARKSPKRLRLENGDVHRKLDIYKLYKDLGIDLKGRKFDNTRQYSKLKLDRKGKKPTIHNSNMSEY